MIYFPDKSDPGSVTSFTQNGEDVEFTTSDGLTLHTWLLSPTGDDRGVAVLYMPGNGGNRLGRLEVGQDIASLGYTVLLLEYRGYGGNPGSPSENGMAADALAAVALLNARGFTAERIIYVGESIGTGVATRLAIVVEPAGIVLRSPFTSMAAVAKRVYPFLPVDTILEDRFDTMSYLRDVTAPIMVLAGSADDLVPVTQSTTVADATPNLFQFVVVDGVGHNDELWFSTYLAGQVDTLARAVVPA